VTKIAELEQVFSTRRGELAMQGVFSGRIPRSTARIPWRQHRLLRQLCVDPNEVRLDGSRNPYFGRTYLGARFPTHGYAPLERETYRAQLAYRLDLAKEKNLLRWLGTHQLLGFGEYKNRVQRRVIYRDVILSDHAWLPRGINRANTAAPASPNVTRSWFNYYVGDGRHQRHYAPRDFASGVYDFH
jgi:hypothetical protein